MARGSRNNKLEADASTAGHIGPSGRSEQKEYGLTSFARIDRFLRGVEQRAFVAARLATRDAEEALDIVQDAMFKLVQKYGSYPEEQWGALFHTILHSRINDWHRRQVVRNRWRVFFFSREDEEGGQRPEDNVAQEQFPEPEQQVLQEEMGEQLMTAIGLLPLRQQQALLLRAWDGYDISATAKIMGCSEGSVKTHYSRAIHSLREKLGDYRQ